MDSNIILKQISLKDKSAFKQLFDAYYKLLYAYARKLVGEDIAHDAVQEVFATIWQKSDQIHITSSLKNYLISGVRNNCLQWLEKQKVRNRYVNDSAVQMAIDEVNFYTGSEDSYQSLVEAELQGKLDESIGKLPAQCQKVFRLSRMDGKKNREIAEELKISQKAVEKHISKALKSLKEDLKEYLPMLMLFLQ